MHDVGNQTKITEFILLGFGAFHNLQIPLFLTFLVTYITTIIGNVLILFLVASDRQLQSPMYFFLGNLSVLEICSSSTILPRMLSALWTGNRRISFSSCFTQWYLCASLGVTECNLLCVMSYDRYLAICKPLHYATAMKTQTCILLAAVPWIKSFTVFFLLLILMLDQLNFCGPNQIDHYYCDYFPFLKLSCGDTSLLKIMCYIVTATEVFLPFLLILSSYIYIITSILRIPSSTGRQKAFSTCSSHLMVVSIYYGCTISVYMVPKTEEMQNMDKFSSLFYIVFPPLANPFIYSLRNMAMKNSLKIMLVRLCCAKQNKRPNP